MKFQASYLTQSQNTDTEPTSPNADPVTSGATRASIFNSFLTTYGMARNSELSL